MDADDARATAGYLVYNDRVGELSHALSEAKATENFDRALAVFTQYAEIVENKTGKNFWSKLDDERKTEFLQSLIVSPQKYVADAAQIANDMTDPDTFDDPTPEGIAKNFAETLENYTANAEESINGVLDRRLEAITQAEEKTKRQRAVLEERQDLSSTDKKVIGDMLEAFNVSVADKFGADEITEISVKTKTPEVDPIKQDEFTERAAFYEYEQGLTRAESERLAMRDVFGEERSEADAFVDTYKSAQIYDDIPFFQRGENESLLKIDSAKEMNGLDADAFSKKMIETLYSFRNRRIPNASIGGEIQIRASSIRKYKSFFADENKRLIVPYIPELLEKAEFTKEKSYAQEKEKNIVSYWKSNIPVNIDGQNYDIHLTVKQDDKGNLFWDAQVKEKARRTVSATNRSVGGLSVESSTLNMDIIPSSERKSKLFYQNAYDEYVRDFEFDDTGFMRDLAKLTDAYHTRLTKKESAPLRQKYGVNLDYIREAESYLGELRERRLKRKRTSPDYTLEQRLEKRKSEEEMQKGREEAAVSLSEDVFGAMSKSERATYERDYASANLRERRAMTASANLEYFTKAVLPEMQKAQEVKNVKKSDISGSLYIDGARVSDHSLPGKYNGDDGVILSGVMSAEDMREAVLQEIEDAAVRNNDRKQREVFYQRAYAGSRVDYDRPSLEAIGSGEGHQAHGWGLYYALNRDVAEKYRRSFTAFALDYEGKEIKQKAADIYIDGKKVDNESALGLAISAKTHRTNKEALEYIRVLRRMNLKRLNQARSESDEDGVRTYEGILSELQEAEQIIEADKITKPERAGQVHEVDIPDPPFLLDEDLPIKEQSPFVKEAVKNYFNSRPDDYIPVETVDNVAWDGRRLYKEVVFQMRREGAENPKKAASETLLKFGIRGITYDGEADGKCFVIFDDKDVNVVQKFYQTVQASVADVSTAQDIKTVRAQAKRYLKEIVRKQDIVHPSLGEIRVSDKGIEEFIKYSSDIRKLALVPHLKELIETSTVGMRETPKHPRKDGIVSFIPLYNEAVIDGVPAKTETLIGVDRKGNLFYDVFLDERRGRRNSGPGTKSGVASTASDINITISEDNGKRFYQSEETARGAYDPSERILYLFKNADPSTIVHELGHHFTMQYIRLLREHGREAELKGILDWLGAKSANDITVEQWERLADAFIVYTKEGFAPSSKLDDLFAALKKYLTTLYEKLVTAAGRLPEISDDVREFFDTMLTVDNETQTDFKELLKKSRDLREVVKGVLRGETLEVNGLSVDDVKALARQLHTRIPRRPKTLEQKIRQTGGIDIDFARSFDLIPLMGAKDAKFGKNGLFRRNGAIADETQLIEFLKSEGYIQEAGSERETSLQWDEAVKVLENAETAYSPADIEQMRERENAEAAVRAAQEALSGIDYDALLEGLSAFRSVGAVAASKDMIRYIDGQLKRIQSETKRLNKKLVKEARQDAARAVRKEMKQQAKEERDTLKERQKEIIALIRSLPLENKDGLISSVNKAFTAKSLSDILEEVKAKAETYYETEKRRRLKAKIDNFVKKTRPKSTKNQKFDYERNKLFERLREYSKLTQEKAAAHCSSIRKAFQKKKRLLRCRFSGGKFKKAFDFCPKSFAAAFLFLFVTAFVGRNGKASFGFLE